jgi:hypothetical protein
MRAVVKPALAVLLVVGVGITGVDLPDRAGPPCDRCCDVADDGDGSARLPAVLPGVCVDVGAAQPLPIDPAPVPATVARVTSVLAAAPKTSPPSVMA